MRKRRLMPRYRTPSAQRLIIAGLIWLVLMASIYAVGKLVFERW
jgi:hypothetical protein